MVDGSIYSSRRKEHVLVLDFDSEEHVRQLLSRSMLVKAAYELLYKADDYERLHTIMRAEKDAFKKYDVLETSFCIKVRPVGRKRGLDCLSIPKTFDYLLDTAPVDLVNPRNFFAIIEHYEHEKSEKPKQIYFTKLVCEGQGSLKMKYNLRDRCYIGNTTMDPELSFIQANIAGVVANDIVLDPFAGTGGLLLPAAEFGAYAIASEINYIVARGDGKSSRHNVKYRSKEESLRANFEQYGTDGRFLAVLIADASNHGVWAQRSFFDVIVADPPYGVREKGRKIGKKERKEHWTLPGAVHPEHIPEKTRYSIESTFTDICDLAATRLRVGGHVCFWFPVILASYNENCLPAHPALELQFNCEQKLTRTTSRRLLTYVKTREPVDGESTTTTENLFDKKTFRDAVFVPQKKEKKAKKEEPS